MTGSHLFLRVLGVAVVVPITVAAPLAFAAPIDTVLRHGFETCPMPAERIVFDGADATPIEGWLWRSRCAQSAHAPAVVMLHGCSGVYPTSGHGDESHVSSRFLRWAADLNTMGMHALLVDSFSTRDPDDPPATSRQNYCNARADVVAIQATEEYHRPRDAVGAYAALIDIDNGSGQALVDPGRVGLLGWSHGGSAALSTVARDYLPFQPFQTAQVFYPGCGLYGAFGNPGNGTSTYVADVPVSLDIGTLDMIASIAACSAHAQHSALAHGAPMSVASWDGALHSFDGVNCTRVDTGPLVSPWTGLRYECSGSHDGNPFTLYDWTARLNSSRRSICDFRTRLMGHADDPCDPGVVHP